MVGPRLSREVWSPEIELLATGVIHRRLTAHCRISYLLRAICELVPVLDRSLRWIPFGNKRLRDGQEEKTFSAEFKARVALDALQERGGVQAIAARHELHPNQLSAWKRQLVDAVPEVFAKGGRRKLAKELDAKIHGLHAKIGELAVQRNSFGAC